MIGAALSIARLAPAWLWVVIALGAWGGFQKIRATSATKAAAAAEQRAAVATATAGAELAERTKEHTFADSTRKAADAYTANTATLRRRADDLRAERDQLLNALASAAPASGAGTSSSAAGRADDTARLRLVVGECTRALTQVAEAADTADARVIGLQEYLRAIGVAPAASAGPK